MPAIDECEPQVIRALAKSGWVVIDQPYHIKLARNDRLYADLRLKNAQENRRLVVVEVKCFSGGRAVIDDFYHAVGQYLMYRGALRLLQLDEPLYLCIPENIYNGFFQRETVQFVVNDARIKLIIVDMIAEEIVTWLE